MTDEERQRQMDFIFEQHAQLTANVDRLSEKVERNADGIRNLLAIAEIHDREITATNEKLNALITTVERFITEGRNGKS